MLVALAALVDQWAELYRNSKALETGVAFLHVGSLLVAGGCAIAADRGTLRAARRPELRTMHLSELGAVHRPVMIGLIIVVVSGALFALADLDTFMHSPLFWIKMGLFALLLANGLRMQRAESALARDADAAPAWRRLVTSSVASLVLWLAVTLVGTALVNAA